MLLFLAKVPGMVLSSDILYERKAFEQSKLTLKLIGIILASNSRYRKYESNHPA